MTKKNVIKTEKKKATPTRSSRKKTVTVPAVGDSILANTELSFDTRSMANVEVRFVGHDVVEPVVKATELPKTIKLNSHPELSKPEVQKNDWSFYALLFTISAFWYAIGLSTATLWGL